MRERRKIPRLIPSLPLMPAALRLPLLISLLATAACAAAHVLTFVGVAFYPILFFVPLLFILVPLAVWRFRRIPRKNFLSEIFADITPGLKIGTVALFLYACANFFICLNLLDGGNPERAPDNRLVLAAKGKIIRELTPAEFRRAQAVQVRLVTGHLIACFAITAFAFHVAWLKTGPALASGKLR